MDGSANPIDSFRCFVITILYVIPMGVHVDGVYTLRFAPQLGHQILTPTVAQKVSRLGECTEFRLAL